MLVSPGNIKRYSSTGTALLSFMSSDLDKIHKMIPWTQDTILPLH